MGISQRLGRIEQAARLSDAQALDLLARRYGLTEADLEWLSILKTAVAAIYEQPEYWYELVDQALADGGLEVTCDDQGEWTAILRDEDEPAGADR